MRTEPCSCPSSSHACTQTWEGCVLGGEVPLSALPLGMCNAIGFPYACPVCPHAMLLVSERELWMLCLTRCFLAAFYEETPGLFVFLLMVCAV